MNAKNPALSVVALTVTRAAHAVRADDTQLAEFSGGFSGGGESSLKPGFRVPGIPDLVQAKAN